MRRVYPHVLGVATLSAALACSSGPGPVARAALLVEHGRDEEAVTLLRGHLAEQPEDTRARRELIRILGVTRRLDEATRESARLAEQLGDRSPTPWVELGHAYELSRRYEEALALYDRAAEVAPADPLGPRTGGMRAARWGEVDWAEPRLTEATRRDPRDARTWHALGLVRVHQGRYKEARYAYQAGLRADPRSSENRVGLATVALRLEDFAAALAEYERLAAERPGYADAHLGRAYALWRMGQTARAEEALADARRTGADARALARLESALRLRADASRAR